MKPAFDDCSPKCQNDRIEGNTIIINGKGEFPKKVIILEAGVQRKYQIIKTCKGRYLFN